VREKLAAKSDQASGRNFEFHADAAGAMIDHLDHPSPSLSEGFGDDANKRIRTVDHRKFNRLELLAIVRPGDDLRLGNLHLVTFAPHHLDYDRQLKLSAARDFESIHGIRSVDSDGHVAERFFIQTLSELSGSDILAFPSRERRRVNAKQH